MAVFLLFVPIIEKRGTIQDIETVVLGDHTLKVFDILCVQAMENRVCFYTKEGELVERSRFRDLMLILNDRRCATASVLLGANPCYSTSGRGR